MTIRYNGQVYRRVYRDGVEYTAAYVDGVPVLLPGGVPVVRSFTINHPRLTIGTTIDRIALMVAASGATRGTLTETLADGSRRTLATQGQAGVSFNSAAGQSLSFVEERPDQSAHYVLSLGNANGVVTEFVDFEYGRAPSIAYWRNAGFRQGALATPDQVLLQWSVTGAVPPATVSITTSRGAGQFHFHPGVQQSGEYAYSRVGAVETELLRLTASNSFGTVHADLTVHWPSRQGG